MTAQALTQNLNNVICRIGMEKINHPRFYSKMAASEVGHGSSLVLSTSKDGVPVFRTTKPEPDSEFDDELSGLSVIVDFTQSPRTISRKLLFEKLREQKLDGKISGLAPLRTHNEWSISFEDALAKEEFLVRKEISIDGIKGEIREFGTNYVHGTVFWLPIQFPMSYLYQVLSHYGKVIKLERKKAQEDGCGHLYNGLRTFVLDLKDGVTPDDLPHKCVIDRQECLLKIQERLAICFSCAKSGHDARNCPSYQKQHFGKSKSSSWNTKTPLLYSTVAAAMKQNSPSKVQPSIQEPTEYSPPAQEVHRNEAVQARKKTSTAPAKAPDSPSRSASSGSRSPAASRKRIKKSRSSMGPVANWGEQMDLESASDSDASALSISTTDELKRNFSIIKQEDELNKAHDDFKESCSGLPQQVKRDFLKYAAKHTTRHIDIDTTDLVDIGSYLKGVPGMHHYIKGDLKENADALMMKYRTLRKLRREQAGN